MDLGKEEEAGGRRVLRSFRTREGLEHQCLLNNVSKKTGIMTVKVLPKSSELLPP